MRKSFYALEIVVIIVSVVIVALINDYIFSAASEQQATVIDNRRIGGDAVKALPARGKKRRCGVIKMSDIKKRDNEVAKSNFQKLLEMEPVCGICGSKMLPMYGCGWDYDHIVCPERDCGAEIMFETTTEAKDKNNENHG
jgi:hypothetical protein